MFQIQRLKDGVWIPASEHTQRIDVEAQLARFIANGIPAEELKIIVPSDNDLS